MADTGTIRNQAAYNAGTKKIVSSVAMVKPPMMAMGPQHTLRVSAAQIDACVRAMESAVVKY